MEKETTTRQIKGQQMAASRSPTTVNDIPEKVLKLIFRRLGSHVSFVRAAAVCTRWRRVASTRGIFNLNHDWEDNLFSTTMGHYHVADDPPKARSLLGRGQQPCRGGVVFVPASPSIDARHFALDFLPSGPGDRPWQLVDGYASLLLLAASHRRRGGLFPDHLVVCEPISRRYFRVEPIDETMKYCRCLGVFLNHGRHGYRVAGTPEFSLTCVLYERSSVGMADGTSAVVVTARFYIHQPRPSCRRWNHGWTTRRLATAGGIHLGGAAVESAHYAGRSKGLIFFGIEDDGTVLAVEEGTGVFSHFRLPEHVRGSHSHHRSSFRFIDNDGADDNNSLVRVVSLVGDELRVFSEAGGAVHNNVGGINWDWDWAPVRSLNLREAARGLRGYKEFFFSQTAKIVTAGNGYVVLTPAEETWLFSVDLGTMEAERQHIRNRLTGDGEVYPYELRSRPTVRACVFLCKRGRCPPSCHICECK